MTEAPNEVRGEMKVAVGDQEFVLVPTFRRIAQVEAALGKSLIELSSQLVHRGVTISDCATIVDLMSRAPKPSRDEIGQLIVDGGVQSVVPLLATFLERVLMGPSRGNPDPTAQ